MESPNSYTRKWFSVLIPLIREIHRVVELKETHKEKLFLIQVALFGSAEDLKEISNEWIDSNIFSASKIDKSDSKIQFISMPQFEMNLQIHLN